MIGIPEFGQRLFRVDDFLLSDQKIRWLRYVQRAQNVHDHPHAAGQVQLNVIQKITKHVRVKDTAHHEQLVQAAKESWIQNIDRVSESFRLNKTKRSSIKNRRVHYPSNVHG